MTPNATDDGVLAPEELELEGDDESIVRLEQNRYLVRPESRGTTSTTRVDADASTPSQPITSVVDARDILAAVPEPHGIDITLKTDGEVAHHRVTSHDVREVFAEMLTWYASQLDDDMSPADALQVMLATTDLEP